MSRSTSPDAGVGTTLADVSEAPVDTVRRVDIDFEPFPPEVRTILLLQYLPAVAVAGLLAVVPVALVWIHLSAPLAIGMWLAVAVASVAAAWWWAGLQLDMRSWRVTDATVELRKGVIWKVHAVLPRNRVQNVTIASGPVRRYLGLATVVAHSAGASTPNIDLECLSISNADQLQTTLLAAGVPTVITPVPPAWG